MRRHSCICIVSVRGVLITIELLGYNGNQDLEFNLETLKASFVPRERKTFVKNNQASMAEFYQDAKIMAF